jgi:SSS family solute:Na+ symporter
MSWIDWLVLIGTLGFIVIYGTIKSRKNTDIDDYLKNDRKLKWWQIGVSVMATQASAITFISTPGQAYEDGMGFIQFYFGLPIAMIILIVFIIPIYHKLNITTAYEYLEGRFGVGVRQLTALLFLIQRSLAAGITIYAPAIILSIVFGINLNLLTFIIGSLVIIYTVTGGSKAVSITQQQQMAVMVGGLMIALGFIIYRVTQFVPFEESINILSKSNKLNIIDTKFDLKNKYNIWSGLIGGTFLSLSYFGTDQSQVGRYLGGKSLREIKLGLTFNAIFKIPMQLMILFTGAMLFVFYIYVKPPVVFNTSELMNLKKSEYADSLQKLESDYDVIFKKYADDQKSIAPAVDHFGSDIVPDAQLKKQLDSIKLKVSELIKVNDPSAAKSDNDFMFIHFVLNYMPVGLVGLLFAVIICAGMSSTSSELNALSATFIIDFYKRSFVKNKAEGFYVKASKYTTAICGVMAIGFAMIFSLFDNLIEAVNIIGSLFYGSILGVFLTGFFIKRVQSRALLFSIVISEGLVITAYVLEKNDLLDFSYLWLNPLGCISVMLLSTILQVFFRQKQAS